MIGCPHGPGTLRAVAENWSHSVTAGLRPLYIQALQVQEVLLRFRQTR